MKQALYRKYRPDRFEDLIGQPQSVIPLQRALKSGRIAHAYLFSGPRGCGKTTAARIFARCLNCSLTDQPVPTPCGKCPSCVDLARGGTGSLDVIEIDAASHRGVDDARDLRDRLNFTPARDRFKIIILDEAHMITQAAFNSLLKVIEEPPSYVKFIFATTEPEKVIETIRSRTYQYLYKLVEPQVLMPYLETICKQEKVQVESGVLNLVIRAGAGSVRDSLSVLDKILAASENQQLELDLVQNILGYLPTDQIQMLAQKILTGDLASVLNSIEQITQATTDPILMLKDLLSYFRDLALTNADANAVKLLSYSDSESAVLNDLAHSYSLMTILETADSLNQALVNKSALSTKLNLEIILANATMANSNISGPSAPPLSFRLPASVTHPVSEAPTTPTNPSVPSPPTATTNPSVPSPPTTTTNPSVPSSPDQTKSTILDRIQSIWDQEILRRVADKSQTAYDLIFEHGQLTDASKNTLEITFADTEAVTVFNAMELYRVVETVFYELWKVQLSVTAIGPELETEDSGGTQPIQSSVQTAPSTPVLNSASTNQSAPTQSHSVLNVDSQADSTKDSAVELVVKMFDGRVIE
ncbi:MAG: DNA polymerase III subunit gamma/tau [Bifidobacteriaceae bacterium]|jgi:DNA polymerase-3 subunit gamma/tau|nr:DNA polymerase III subunit gamma/tau [Bifidobacteriaceae bacterium]